MPQHHKHHSKALSLFEKLILVIAVAEPLATLPQIYQIWINKQTTGVSIVTWSLYAIAAGAWLIYAINIKSKPLIISSGLWVITETLVAVGAIIN